MNKRKNNKFYIHVLDINGNPIMPTCRYRNARHLLKEGKAKIIRRNPFTIKLLYDLETTITQNICLGLDIGRTNIGISAVREDGKCLFMAHCSTRNKEIPKLMEKRAEHRNDSRRGERLRRKRRAKKNNTTIKNESCSIDKFLKGYPTPFKIKDIKGTEAKFNNRKRPAGWLTPTATQLLRTHINLFKLLSKTLPITDICIEVNNFLFVKRSGLITVDSNSKRTTTSEYMRNIHNHINELQNGTCILCNKNSIEHYHHVLPRSQNGSSTITNLVGLCSKCHTMVHIDIKTKERLDKLHTKQSKQCGAMWTINQIMFHLIDKFELLLPNHVHLTDGQQTKSVRDRFGISKEHEFDAYCIGLQAFNLNKIKIDHDNLKTYDIQQFRRQNRAHIHHLTDRTYKLDNVIVAKNRKKRTEQFVDSLYDIYLKWVQLYGKEKATKMRSNLRAISSKKCRYSNINRAGPGSIFKYSGQYYVLTGQKDNGFYYQAYGYGERLFPSKKCQIIVHNRGLVYVT